MQLKRLSLSFFAAQLLVVSNLCADDYISVQYMNYDEESGRTTVSTPAIEISKDFGVDYNIKASFVHDALSGASPTWYDSSSGATSMISDGTLFQDDIVYDYIDYDDSRDAFAAAITTRFASRDELTFGLNYSNENDYTSREISVEFLHYLDALKNRSLTFGFSYQNNDVTVFCSDSSCDASSGASPKKREKEIEVLTAQVGITQIIDADSLVKAALFYIAEEGYLSNPYMNVVRDYYGLVHLTLESKPDTRDAYGMQIEYYKSLGALSYNASYRLYNDDWEIMSHTFDLQLYYAYSKKLTVGVGGRFYTQDSAYFYSDRKDYFTDERYASSDRRVSDFASYNAMFSAKYRFYEDLSVNASLNYYTQPEYFDAIYYNFGFIYEF